MSWETPALAAHDDDCGSHIESEEESPPPPPPFPPSSLLVSQTGLKLSHALKNQTPTRSLLKELSVHVNNILASPPPPPPSHTASMCKKKRSLSTQEWDDMVSRLYESKAKRDENVLESAQLMAAKQEAECTFSPTLNPYSLSMKPLYYFEDIATRSAEGLQKRSQRIKEEKLLLEKLEDEKLSFRPTLVSKPPKVDITSRLDDNPLSRRMEAIRAEEKVKAETFASQHPFEPKLNPKSMALVKKKERSRHHLATPVSVKQPELPTFRPIIDAHSQKMVHSQSDFVYPVFDRLYQQRPTTRTRSVSKEDASFHPEIDAHSKRLFAARKRRGDETTSLPVYERLYQLAAHSKS